MININEVIQSAIKNPYDNEILHEQAGKFYDDGVVRNGKYMIYKNIETDKYISIFISEANEVKVLGIHSDKKDALSEYHSTQKKIKNLLAE